MAKGTITKVTLTLNDDGDVIGSSTDITVPGGGTPDDGVICPGHVKVEVHRRGKKEREFTVASRLKGRRVEPQRGRFWKELVDEPEPIDAGRGGS